MLDSSIAVNKMVTTLTSDVPFFCWSVHRSINTFVGPASDTSSLMSSLTLLPATLMHLTLYRLLPLSPTLLKTLATASPNLRTLHGFFDIVISSPDEGLTFSEALGGFKKLKKLQLQIPGQMQLRLLPSNVFHAVAAGRFNMPELVKLEDVGVYVEDLPKGLEELQLDGGWQLLSKQQWKNVEWLGQQQEQEQEQGQGQAMSQQQQQQLGKGGEAWLQQQRALRGEAGDTVIGPTTQQQQVEEDFDMEADLSWAACEGGEELQQGEGDVFWGQDEELGLVGAGATEDYGAQLSWGSLEGCNMCSGLSESWALGNGRSISTTSSSKSRGMGRDILMQGGSSSSSRVAGNGGEEGRQEVVGACGCAAQLKELRICSRQDVMSVAGLPAAAAVAGVGTGTAAAAVAAAVIAAASSGGGGEGGVGMGGAATARAEGLPPPPAAAAAETGQGLLALPAALATAAAAAAANAAGGYGGPVLPIMPAGVPVVPGVSTLPGSWASGVKRRGVAMRNQEPRGLGGSLLWPELSQSPSASPRIVKRNKSDSCMRRRSAFAGEGQQGQSGIQQQQQWGGEGLSRSGSDGRLPPFPLRPSVRATEATMDMSATGGPAVGGSTAAAVAVAIAVARASAGLRQPSADASGGGVQQVPGLCQLQGRALTWSPPPAVARGNGCVPGSKGVGEAHQGLDSDQVGWSSPEPMSGLVEEGPGQQQQQEEEEEEEQEQQEEELLQGLEGAAHQQQQKEQQREQQEDQPNHQQQGGQQWQQRREEEEEVHKVPALCSLSLAGCLMELSAAQQLLACSWGKLQKLALPSDGWLPGAPPAAANVSGPHSLNRLQQQEQEGEGEGGQAVNQRKQQWGQEPEQQQQGQLGMQQLQQLPVGWQVVQELDLDALLLLHLLAVHESAGSLSVLKPPAAAGVGAATAGVRGETGAAAVEVGIGVTTGAQSQQSRLWQTLVQPPQEQQQQEAVLVHPSAGAVAVPAGHMQSLLSVQADLRLVNLRRLVVRVTNTTLDWLQQPGHVSSLVQQLMAGLGALPSLREVSIVGVPASAWQTPHAQQLVEQQVQQQQLHGWQHQQQVEQMLNPAGAAFADQQGSQQQQKAPGTTEWLSPMQAWELLEEEVAEQLGQLPHCRVSLEQADASK